MSLEENIITPDDQHVPLNGERISYACLVDHMGAEIDIRGWRAKDSKFPPIVFVHDIGESLTIYRNVAKIMCERSFTCYGFDLRGHGTSGKRFAHIQKFETLVRDLLQIIAWVRRAEKGRKPIIVGQGIGALITVYFLEKFPDVAQAAVLTAPIFQLREELRLRTWQKIFIKTFAEISPKMLTPKWLRPKLSNPFHKPSEETITSKIYEALVERDLFPISCAFMEQLIEAIEGFPARYRRISLPHLVILPGRDEISDVTKWQEVAQKHPKQEVITSETIPEMSHNGFTESDETLLKLVEIIEKWVRSQK